jgi:hypothetical protein
MEVVFQGNYTRQQIQSASDRVLPKYDLPVNDEYYEKAGSALVALRESTGIQEMDILACVNELDRETTKLNFPESVGLCATLLSTNSEIPPASQASEQKAAASPTESDFPEDVLTHIKTAAKQEYPDDNRMQLFTIKKESQAYLDVRAYTDPNLPADILVSVLSAAKAEYPNEYSMQLFTIKKEVEAYYAVQSYSAPGVPDDILAKIMATTQADYPSEYSMQLYTIKKEIDAYKAVQNFSAPDVPTENLDTIIGAAQADYPSDYSMQLYTIKKEVDAYREVNK